MIETKRLLLIPVDFEMIDSLIESNKAFLIDMVLLTMVVNI